MSTILRFLMATNSKSPLLRTVVPTVAAAFALQTAVALPSVLAGTEKFFDLSGSVTFLSCTALSLGLPLLRARFGSAAAAASTGAATATWKEFLTGGAWGRATGAAAGRAGSSAAALDWRQVALSGCVGLWALRLGSYLFLRIVKDGGKDTRFDKIRDRPLLLSTVFLAQAFWVSICLLPVMSLNALPASAFAGMSAINPITALGFAIYAFGLTYEVLADRQKTEWLKQKRAKKHDQDFITSGFWRYHRYPNYFGEITLWAGMAVAAGGVLSSPAGQVALGWAGWPLGRLVSWLICGASPAFSALVLIKGSGVPPSERKYDERYGNRKDYQDWRNNTPMIIPKIW